MMGKYNNMISELGGILGVDLELDENNQCLISVNNILISIIILKNRMVFYANLCEINDYDTLVMALSINATVSESGLGGIGYDSLSDSIVFIRSIEIIYDPYAISEILREVIGVSTKILSDLPKRNI
ncbi:hypothetical protein F0225_13940 [Vibrio pectenicida]|uniref:Uncharacterized protein n=1 Tax=Vibrio pectenicida TaxID=62763 RepID=A0A7Y4A0M7_9VIBR|nr:CesT family type III secretion system chaperone [Vibrio pectenicida]NOH72432.1 hypothetical protein [Vibrio pectenicida]